MLGISKPLSSQIKWVSWRQTVSRIILDLPGYCPWMLGTAAGFLSYYDQDSFKDEQ